MTFSPFLCAQIMKKVICPRRYKLKKPRNYLGHNILYQSKMNSCSFIEFIFFGFNLVIIQTLCTTHAKAVRAGSKSSIARRGVCGSSPSATAACSGQPRYYTKSSGGLSAAFGRRSIDVKELLQNHEWPTTVPCTVLQLLLMCTVLKSRCIKLGYTKKILNQFITY